MTDLLPCPFCGGEAEIWRASADPKRPAWVGCMGRCAVLVSREYETTEEAIAAWNRRTPPAAVPEGWVMVPKEPTQEMTDCVAGYFDFQTNSAAHAYRAMISAAPAAPNGWQDISTAPKDGTQIILLSANGTRQLGWWSEAASAWAYGGGSWGENITDWMPLPAAPTEASDE